MYILYVYAHSTYSTYICTFCMRMHTVHTVCMHRTVLYEALVLYLCVANLRDVVAEGMQDVGHLADLQAVNIYGRTHICTFKPSQQLHMPAYTCAHAHIC